MPGGRPLKFRSAEELETKINDYFHDCDLEYDHRVFKHGEIIKEATKRVCTNCWQNEKARGCLWISGELKKKRPYTVSGLALWLGTTRQTLLNYEEKDEFLDTIIAAKQKIENFAAEKLFDPDAPQRGVIFSLSNNSDGWTEKREQTVKVPKDGAAELAAGLLGEHAAKQA